MFPGNQSSITLLFPFSTFFNRPPVLLFFIPFASSALFFSWILSIIYYKIFYVSLCINNFLQHTIQRKPVPSCFLSFFSLPSFLSLLPLLFSLHSSPSLSRILFSLLSFPFLQCVTTSLSKIDNLTIIKTVRKKMISNQIKSNQIISNHIISHHIISYYILWN